MGRVQGLPTRLLRLAVNYYVILKLCWITTLYWSRWTWLSMGVFVGKGVVLLILYFDPAVTEVLRTQKLRPILLVTQSYPRLSLVNLKYVRRYICMLSLLPCILLYQCPPSHFILSTPPPSPRSPWNLKRKWWCFFPSAKKTFTCISCNEMDCVVIFYLLGGSNLESFLTSCRRSVLWLYWMKSLQILLLASSWPF